MRTTTFLMTLTLTLFSVALRAEPRGPDGPPAASKPQTPGGCTLSGTAIPDLDLQILDASGRAVARFGGVATPISLTDFPERADGKVKVTTGGEGRLRVTGSLSARAIPFFLKQDVSLVGDHVTLLRGTSVEYVGRSGEQLRIVVKTTQAFAESYAATVACDALTVEPQQPTKWAPPGHARAYLMKQSSISLFDKPSAEAKSVVLLHLAPNATSALFFGDRREGDFIHVLYHRDVGLDEWVSSKELEILPRGELADQSATKISPPMDKRLQMKADGQLYQTQSQLLLYGRADPKLGPIGSVAKNTELYVLDVVVGWASVLPKHLDVVPVTDRQFWVRASELGI